MLPGPGLCVRAYTKARWMCVNTAEDYMALYPWTAHLLVPWGTVDQDPLQQLDTHITKDRAKTYTLGFIPVDTFSSSPSMKLLILSYLSAIWSLLFMRKHNFNLRRYLLMTAYKSNRTGTFSVPTWVILVLSCLSAVAVSIRTNCLIQHKQFT